MNNLITRIFTATLIAITANTAMAEFLPADYDTSPPDGKLSPSEQQGYTSALMDTEDPATEPLRTHYYFEVERLQTRAGPGKPILVADFTPFTPRENCPTDNGFFLRSTVQNEPQIGCVGLGAIPNGALFSYENDNEAGNSTFVFNGAVALQLFGGYRDLTGLSRTGMHLTRFPVSIFAEGHGSSFSDKPDAGTIRTGLKTDLLWQGGALDSLTLTSSVYYQTDMGLGGSGYGLQAVLTPQKVNAYIGGAPSTDLGASSKDPTFYYLPSLVVDGFHIDEPGETGLASGQDYLWFGALLKLVLEHPGIGPHGAKAELTGSYFGDAIGGDTAALGTASAQIYLDEAKKTSVGLFYEKGQIYNSLQDVDRLTVSLGLKF